MSRRRPSTGERLLEALLWAAVLLTGMFVLIPSAVELVQARELKDSMEQEHRRSEESLFEEHQALERLLQDPQTDEKLLEQQQLGSRRGPDGAGEVPAAASRPDSSTTGDSMHD